MTLYHKIVSHPTLPFETETNTSLDSRLIGIAFDTATLQEALITELYGLDQWIRSSDCTIAQSLKSINNPNEALAKLKDVVDKTEDTKAYFIGIQGLTETLLIHLSGALDQLEPGSPQPYKPYSPEESSDDEAELTEEPTDEEAALMDQLYKFCVFNQDIITKIYAQHLRISDTIPDPSEEIKRIKKEKLENDEALDTNGYFLAIKDLFQTSVRQFIEAVKTKLQQESKQAPPGCLSPIKEIRPAEVQQALNALHRSISPPTTAPKRGLPPGLLASLNKPTATPKSPASSGPSKAELDARLLPAGARMNMSFLAGIQNRSVPEDTSTTAENPASSGQSKAALDARLLPAGARMNMSFLAGIKNRSVPEDTSTQSLPVARSLSAPPPPPAPTVSTQLPQRKPAVDVLQFIDECKAMIRTLIVPANIYRRLLFMLNNKHDIDVFLADRANAALMADMAEFGIQFDKTSAPEIKRSLILLLDQQKLQINEFAAHYESGNQSHKLVSTLAMLRIFKENPEYILELSNYPTFFEKFLDFFKTSRDIQTEDKEQLIEVISAILPTVLNTAVSDKSYRPITAILAFFAEHLTDDNPFNDQLKELCLRADYTELLFRVGLTNKLKRTWDLADEAIEAGGQAALRDRTDTVYAVFRHTDFVLTRDEFQSTEKKFTTYKLQIELMARRERLTLFEKWAMLSLFAEKETTVIEAMIKEKVLGVPAFRAQILLDISEIILDTSDMTTEKIRRVFAIFLKKTPTYFAETELSRFKAEILDRLASLVTEDGPREHDFPTQLCTVFPLEEVCAHIRTHYKDSLVSLISFLPLLDEHKAIQKELLANDELQTQLLEAVYTKFQQANGAKSIAARITNSLSDYVKIIEIGMDIATFKDNFAAKCIADPELALIIFSQLPDPLLKNISTKCKSIVEHYRDLPIDRCTAHQKAVRTFLLQRGRLLP